eukprot:jgi/Tetstr1/444335/TSEL_032226.t1
MLLTGLPAGTDDATHVALLFGDMVAQHQAMDDESCGRTLANLIRTLSLKIGVRILPAHGELPPALSKQFFRCALTARGICTGPVANPVELPTVKQLAQAIAATISQRIDTPPELQHAKWLTETMMAAGVEMQQYHTEPKLLLRAVRLRTIVIYLTESEFDPSELLIHPFSQTVREAGELGGSTGHNQLRRTTMGMRKKA